MLTQSEILETTKVLFENIKKINEIHSTLFDKLRDTNDELVKIETQIKLITRWTDTINKTAGMLAEDIKADLTDSRTSEQSNIDH